MSETRMEIAIIDDGVNEKNFENIILKDNIEITPELDIVKRQGYDAYALSHGTLCAAIIKKYASAAIINSIKILNENDRGLASQLVKAISWCVENKIRLLNLSLGSIKQSDYKEIRQAINTAYKNGLIIVAACNNIGVVTYPASFSNVIGVKQDITNTLDEGEFQYNTCEADGIDITACGKHTLTGCNGIERVIKPSNSFAAPLITAYIYNILASDPGTTLENIRRTLYRQWAGTAEYEHNLSILARIDWVEKAVIFNLFRGEENQDYLNYVFEISECVEIQCLTLREGLGKVQEHLEKCNCLDRADTLIVLAEDSQLVRNPEDFISFLNLTRSYGKNAVYIDDFHVNDLSLQKLIVDGIKVWHPLTAKLFTSHIRNKIETDIPVIGVLDLSGKKLVHTVKSLSELFVRDNFTPVTSVDSSMGIITGLEYSPLVKITDTKDKSEYLVPNSLDMLYYADIWLMGLTAEFYDMTILKNSFRNINADLWVVITDNPSSAIEIFPVEQSGAIYILPCKSLDKAAIEELYNYILNLFSGDS